MPEDAALLRDRHVERFQALLSDHQRRIEWSAAQLHEQRFQALRTLVEVAVERSRWHRTRLEPLRVDDLRDAELLQQLPVMTKSDLIANFDEIVTDNRLNRRLCENHLDGTPSDRYLLGEYNVVASSGSSGQRGVFVYGWDAWATCYASIVRFQQRDWESDPNLSGVPRVTAVVGAANPTHLSAALGRTFSSPHAPRYIFPVTQPLSSLVDGLNDLQPTVLMGYSSFLPRLAIEARAHRLHIAPRRVVAIAEPLPPELRSMVEEAWGAPVASGYGMSEGAFTGACNDGLHLPDDLCIIEAVDAEGRPVTPGERSQRLYVTNLYNHTLPLIRYEVTDELTLVDDLCPCGCAMRRVEDPQGRLDDLFEYENGVVHPHVFRSLLGSHHQIVEYQVRQTLHGAHIDVVVDQNIDHALLSLQIETALAGVGVDTPCVTSATVESIERQASGKLKRFYPLDE